MKDVLKERSVKINLSDKKAEQLVGFCEMNNTTVSKLFECFVSELVNDTLSYGGDERVFIRMWFDCFKRLQCNDNSLLTFLLKSNQMDDYLAYLTNLEEDWNDLVENASDYTIEEVREIEENMDYWREQLTKITEGWVPDEGVDKDEEVEKVKKWKADRDNFIGGQE